LNLGDVLSSGGYAISTRHRAHDVDEGVGPIEPRGGGRSFAAADRNPPVFDPDRHTINVPGELAKSVQAVKTRGVVAHRIAQEIGGVPAPRRDVGDPRDADMANPSATFWYARARDANALYVEGNEQQKRWAAMGLERAGGDHWC